MNNIDNTKKIKSFVVRGGRMTNGQEKAYTLLFPKYGLVLENRRVDYKNMFGNGNPVIAEIGFGNGTATAEIAEKNSGFNYLGIEVYPPGIGNLLKLIEEKKIENIRILQGDAVEVFTNMMPKGFLEGIHLFFPDPWPKKKHHKRRIIRPELMPLFVETMSEGGYFYFVTDWEHYAREALGVLEATPGLQNQYSGFASPQQWRPDTKFNAKGRSAGRQIFECYFVKEGRN